MWFHRPGFRSHTVFAFLVLVIACKKGAAPFPPPTDRTELPPREVNRDSALLFAYVEPNGIFATTDKAEKVPDTVRRLVRVKPKAVRTARPGPAPHPA